MFWEFKLGGFVLFASRVVDGAYDLHTWRKSSFISSSLNRLQLTSATQLLTNCWLVFKSYFGGRSSEAPPGSRWGARFLFLSIFLTGNVVFIAYRGSITSELAILSLKLPFETLGQLLNSDYR